MFQDTFQARDVPKFLSRLVPFLTLVNRRGLDLLLFFQVFPSSDVVFVLPADEVYEKDLLKSGFPQQSSVTSSSEPAGARPPFVSNFDNITRFIGLDNNQLPKYLYN